jgi:hypothetical protein
VTFILSAGTSVATSGFPYILSIGTTPNGTDIVHGVPVAPGSNRVSIPSQLFTGITVYVTVSTGFADGTSASSAALYTLQSVIEAMMGTYLLPQGFPGEVSSINYCQGSLPRFALPTIAQIPNSTLTIGTTATGGSFYLSMSNVGVAALPTYQYILIVAQQSVDQLVFAPSTALQSYGWATNPTAFPGITVTRTYQGAGDTGSIQINTVNGTGMVTFEGLLQEPSCMTVFDDTVTLLYRKSIP